MTRSDIDCPVFVAKQFGPCTTCIPQLQIETDQNSFHFCPMCVFMKTFIHLWSLFSMNSQGLPKDKLYQYLCVVFFVCYICVYSTGKCNSCFGDTLSLLLKLRSPTNFILSKLRVEQILMAQIGLDFCVHSFLSLACTLHTYIHVCTISCFLCIYTLCTSMSLLFNLA